MEINKIKRSLLVLFLSFLAIGAQAQLEQAVKKIFAGDTITNGHVPLKRDSDSIHLRICGNRWKKPGSMKRICGWKWSR